MEPCRRFGRGGFIRDRHAGQFFRFHLIRCDHIGHFQKLVRNGIVRCRVDDHLAAVFRRCLGHHLIGFLIYLKLEQHVFAFFQHFTDAFHFFRCMGIVGPRNNDDLVLACALIHKNKRNARLGFICVEQMVLVHVELVHHIHGDVCKGIFSHFCDHRHIGSRLVCRNTLVESLAAGSHPEHASAHCLGRDRQMRRTCHQIHNKTSENRNFTAHLTVLTFLTSDIAIRKL